MLAPPSLGQRRIAVSFLCFDVRLVGQQEGDHIRMALFSRRMERCHLVEILAVVHHRPLGDEQLHDVEISAIGGRMQCGQPAFVANFDIDAALQQHGDDAGVSSEGCQEQGRLTGAVGFGHVKALVQQAFRAFDIAILGGIVQRTGCSSGGP